MHHPQEVALGASQPQQGKGKPSVTLHRGVLLGSIDTQGGGGSATRKMLPDRAGRYFTDRGGCIPLRRRGDKIRKTGSHWDNKGTFLSLSQLFALAVGGQRGDKLGHLRPHAFSGFAHERFGPYEKRRSERHTAASGPDCSDQRQARGACQRASEAILALLQAAGT